MFKSHFKLYFAILLSLIMLVIAAASINAVTPASGYLSDSAGSLTNIKYDLTEDGVLTLEIDPAATDKVQTTVVENRDPVTATYAAWNRPLPTFAEITKLIVGDGITSISGFSAITSLQYVEIPTSLTHIGQAAFECCYGIQAFYIRGNEPEIGTFDFSNITNFENYCFDGNPTIKKVIMNPNMTSAIPVEFIKYAQIKELELPAGVTILVDQSLDGLPNLQTLTVLGMNTEFKSVNVFTETEVYPAIKAYSGSKAEAFAKANGFTFIDIETGEITEGTRKAPENIPDEDISGPVINFEPEGATAFGKVTGAYYNTWWAYYGDTKTLEFVSATANYNETGNFTNCEDSVGWSQYIDEIEHIIVGDYISKISGGAFYNYPNLIDCRLGKHCGQLDGSFINCPKFTTIWRAGSERIEGRADLSQVFTKADCFSGNAIKEIVLNPEIQSFDFTLPINVTTVYNTKITEELIEYCEESFSDLINLNDPEEKYENYVYIDPNLPRCGMRANYSFDEATGTLTIGGAGVVDDIVNYYGGGSKTAPWFSIKQQIKHIVIEDGISVLGKYTFCQAANLETVEIPNNAEFQILNGAFEKCISLKSIYVRGSEPIEGTLDLRNFTEIPSWTYNNTYLIANVIFGENIGEINGSAFDDNPNLAAIYGVPGTVAEEFAVERGVTFYDISSNTPQPVICTPPETTGDATESTADDSETAESLSDTDTEAPVSTDTEKPTFDFVENDSSSGGSGAVILIVIIVVVVAAAVVVFVIVKKRKK